MSRNIVALALLALAGAILSLPEPAFAAGGARGAMPGFRAGPMFAPRAGMLRHRPVVLPRPHGHRTFGHHGLGRHAFGHRTLGHRELQARFAHKGFARTSLDHPHVRLARRYHRIYHAGWHFPAVIGETGSYLGVPYDPSEVIPVYAPEPAAEAIDPPPPVRRSGPVLSIVRDENAEACRSERVTVPASEGERQITVVRC